MTERTPNIPLLRKAVEWAEAEHTKGGEGAWVQGAWILHDRPCGTAYCIAGYVGQLVDERYANTTQGWTITGPDGAVDTTTPHVSEVAAEALGITRSHEAGDLFQASNTVEDVRRIAEEIAGEAL